MAIGASAGGLEAMTRLLQHLPDATGMAYVFVQHLDPNHESALASLLTRETEMPVREARHGLRLEADHLYVIPPNRAMSLEKGRLRLTPRRKDRQTPLPIDEFFQALAEQEGNRAIGVLLSGNGSDGTAGLEAIKAAGGITLAQEEQTARFSAMPASAIRSGCVDFVLSPERMAEELARISGHPYVGQRGGEAGMPVAAEPKPFAEILATLRQRTGVDFSSYKIPTLQRRIHRRMVLHRLESLKDYAVFLGEHADEVNELFNDVLIRVTGFFRDAAVFRALKRRVFSRLIKGKSGGEALRVWVPGCSTGEEVYSLAITLTEYLEEKKLRLALQIFGTDINERALEKARSGLYPEGMRNEIGLERVQRFFVAGEAGLRVCKGIRDQCIFARQNLAADPPFSNLDLISCRNVLIYLGSVLQRKIMPVFHYALRPEGCLLLGASENIGAFGDLFAVADSRCRIYVKKSVQHRPAVRFEHEFAGTPAPALRQPAPSAAPASNLADVQRLADRLVLSQHAPPGVVINRQMEVVQFRGRTGPYLEHGQGEASLNLLKMAREGLGLDLRAVINQAVKQNVPAHREGAYVKRNGGSRRVDLDVIPFGAPGFAERFYLVLFHPVHAPPEPERKRGKRVDGLARAEAAELARLREEVASSRESLQAVVEEQETTNEELRSANEEIMSSNEELQSTNEELETAKEELQSTNEELTTLNDELESRNADLEHAHNDITNLLASVHIPIIIVGPALRIRRFTVAAEKLFNLIPADTGRPLTDINLNVDQPRLDKVVLEVIANLQTRELEVQDRQGRWWLLRVRPYRTSDNKIDGAVIVLMDIDIMKKNADRRHEARLLAAEIVDSVRDSILLLDRDGKIVLANQPFFKMFATNANETLGRSIYDLGNQQWAIPGLRKVIEGIGAQNSVFQDFAVEHTFPRVGRKRVLINGRQLVHGADGVPMILLVVEDVTERRQEGPGGGKRTRKK